MGHPIKLLWLAALMLTASVDASAQDNSFATVIQNNSAMQYSMALATLNGSQLNARQTREFVFGVNDQLARRPQFALLSPVEKQNNSDSLIFQTAMIVVLRDMAQRDPQARQRAIALSRTVLQRLNGT